jgi:hypothetical protein
MPQQKHAAKSEVPERKYNAKKVWARVVLETKMLFNDVEVA